jgi:hypothetical protein
MKNNKQEGNTMKRLLLMLALVVTVGLGQANAVLTPGFTLDTTTGTALGNPPFTLGFTFTATTPIIVSRLSIFDDSQDGLVDQHPVGLFDAGGNLLASTTIQSGTGSPLMNQFRYENIAATTLPAGDYSIGALYTTGNDALVWPGMAVNFATAPGITFNMATFMYGGTLLAPTADYSLDPAFFGPNFAFTTPIPEASTCLAGISACLALLGTLVRRIRK